MPEIKLVIQVHHKVQKQFTETIEAFAIVSPGVKWSVTRGVGEDGHMVTLNEANGATPADIFTLGSLLSDLHGSIYLDAFDSPKR